MDYKISAAGSCVIDVGGKDELAVFFNLCKKLKINGRILADLDAFFKGKLREVAQSDADCNKYIQDNGFGTELSTLIGELDRKLKEIADELIGKTTSDTDIIHIINFLKPIISINEKRASVVTSMIIALKKFKKNIYNILSPNQQANINYVMPRLSYLLEAFKAANIFIIPDGEIEHYYSQTQIDYLNFTDTDKNASFHKERDYILSASKADLERNYSNLLDLLKSSVPLIKVDLSKHLKYQIIEWVQTIQRAISKGEVKEIETLKTNAKIDYKLFSQIVEVIDLQIQEDKKFNCTIRVNKSLSPTNKELNFSEKTIPHDFEFSI